MFIFPIISTNLSFEQQLDSEQIIPNKPLNLLKTILKILFIIYNLMHYGFVSVSQFTTAVIVDV